MGRILVIGAGGVSTVAVKKIATVSYTHLTLPTN